MASSTLFLASYRPLKTQKNLELERVLEDSIACASSSFELFGPSIPLLLSTTELPISLGLDLKSLAWQATRYSGLTYKKGRLFMPGSSALPEGAHNLIAKSDSHAKNSLVFNTNDLVLDFDLMAFFGLDLRVKPTAFAQNDTAMVTLDKVSLDFDIIKFDRAQRHIEFYTVHRFHVKNLH